MKQFWTYIFVILYALAIMRPIIPVIEYIVDYDYISKVLCINKDKPELKCNGQCHLSKEMKKMLPVDLQDEQPALPTIDFDKYSITPITICQYKIKDFEYSNRLNFFSNKIGKIKNYIEIQFQPPELLV